MAYHPLTRILSSDSPSIDAFGRWRVSDPYTLYDCKFLHDKQTLFWEESLSTVTSVYGSGLAQITLAIGNGQTGSGVRQTYRKFNYSPAKSQLVFQTFVMGTGQTNVVKRIGMYDVGNGIFLQQSGTTISLVVRKNGSDASAVAQASWNLDPMTAGTGPSGKTIDWTKAQIMVIDFEWLGVGRVRVGFVIDGVIYYVHQFIHANSVTAVYMGTPNLPLRCELVAGSAAGGDASFIQICSSVISEGGKEKLGFVFGVDRGSTSLVTLNDANIYPLLAVRLLSGRFDSEVIVDNISIICTSTTAYRWLLLLNPTITGTALSYSTVANTSIEAATGITNGTTVSGGTVLASGYSLTSSDGSASYAPQTFLALGSTLAGVADQVILAVQRLTGTTETFYASMNLRQQV